MLPSHHVCSRYARYPQITNLTGKSTATRVLRSLGATVIDFDQLAREVVEVGEPAWMAIRNEFGASVFRDGTLVIHTSTMHSYICVYRERRRDFTHAHKRSSSCFWFDRRSHLSSRTASELLYRVSHSDDTLDRKKLGDLVFGQPDKLRLLNKLMRSHIQRAFVRHLLYAFFWKWARVVVLDVPLLFEQNLHYLCSEVLVVGAPEAVMVQRVMQRDQCDEPAARQKIAAQWYIAQDHDFSLHVCFVLLFFFSLSVRVTAVCSLIERFSTGLLSPGRLNARRN
jgi:dephospho-CoA kinase